MSIPKTIHYVWIGGKENIPEQDLKYIEGWRKLNPDFSIRLWDEKAIDLKKYPLVKKAIEEKRYALASDIIRMYVVYEMAAFILIPTSNFASHCKTLRSTKQLLAGNQISGSRQRSSVPRSTRRGLAKF